MREAEAEAGTAWAATTRRQVVGRGVAAGVAGAALLPLGLAVGIAEAQGETDADIVRSAILFEQVDAVTYAAAARSGVAGAAAARVFARFARQELEHAAAWRTALEALGGTAPAPARSARSQLAEATSEAEVVRLAIDFESAGVAAYLGAQSRLRDPTLLRTAASVMACEGQHLTVLRALIERELVPEAFETGRR